MSDLMLLGVLRMPIKTHNGPLSPLAQFVARAREAADRIEADAERIRALEAERDQLRAQLKAALAERDDANEECAVRIKERDQARAEVDALREANSTFASASILPDDKVIADRAEVDALRADAARYAWVRNADGFALDRMMDKADTCVDFDALVDAARKDAP